MSFSAEKFSFMLAFILLFNHASAMSTVPPKNIATYHRETTFDDLLPKTVTQWSLANSVVQCGRLCQAEKWCNSFFYSYGNTTCALQRKVYMSLWSDQTVSAPGWRYYRLTSADQCPSKDDAIDRVTATCYRLVMSPLLIWLDARAACNSSNERLVVLEQEEKAYFVYDFLNTNKALHNYGQGINIGASRPELDWNTPMSHTGPTYVWVNGQPLDLNATQPFWTKKAHFDDPLDDALCLKQIANYTWILRPHKKKRSYMCERAYW